MRVKKAGVRVKKRSGEHERKPRVVRAKRPNHVWRVDLSIVPLVWGFWATWLPCGLPQCWPFCYWVAAVVDHYARRAMSVASFRAQPDSEAVRAFLGRTISRAGTAPKHLVCDRGGTENGSEQKTGQNCSVETPCASFGC